MAELTPRERRQPCLLDRLTDDEPQAALESRDKRVIGSQQFRRAVLRDLSWLLNTSSRMEDDEAAEFPEVARSVLNYGVPDMCGLTTSTVDPTRVERMVRQAIERYEPRILSRSLKVKAVADADEMSPNAVSFKITGELWAQPMPEHLYVKTDVDLETGQCKVEDRPNG
jgi:type VI secretion system protein ImpF